MSKYSKLLASLAAWVATSAALVGDGDLSSGDKLAIVGGFVGCVAVFFAPANKPA